MQTTKTFKTANEITFELRPEGGNEITAWMIPRVGDAYRLGLFLSESAAMFAINVEDASIADMDEAEGVDIADAASGGVNGNEFTLCLFHDENLGRHNPKNAPTVNDSLTFIQFLIRRGRVEQTGVETYAWE